MMNVHGAARGWIARLAIGAIALVPALAAAQAAYPSRPIKLVTPYAAGGLTDTVARGYAEALSQSLGQPVVVENRAGAGTTVATKSVMASAPDGYTLYAGTTSLVINPTLQSGAGYDWRTAVTPVALMMLSPFILHVNPQVPAANAKELGALIKANPGKYSFGSSGIGAINHLTGELWKARAGLQMTHVPYKGGAPAAQDLVAGNIQMMFSAVLEAKPFIDGGRTRALAITSTRRIELMPELPTMEEATGIAGLASEFWMGLFVPPGTPQPIVDRLADAVNQVAANAAFRERFARQGVVIRGSSPAELRDLMIREEKQWSQIIRENGIKE